MKNNFTIALGVSIVLLIAVCTSCKTIKNYRYFEDLSDTAKITQIYNNNFKDPIIKVDDILYIAIQTIDPGSGASINALNAQGSGGNLPSESVLSSAAITGNQATTYGYLVDKKGDVRIPVLGDVHLAGVTTTEARDIVTTRALLSFKTPSVIIRFANFKISVLGEVQRPGIYTVPNERVTLLDALSYAGDLTIYGRRDNILLFRKQDNGVTSAIRLNLNSSEILKSPYFYLQQNDQIYVEPSKARIDNSDATQARNISILTAAITLVVIIVSRIK